MDLLDWLQNWCLNYLTNNVANTPSIKIGTLDNPGWAVDIQLTDTPFEKRKFAPIKIDDEEHDWVHCKIENSIFYGRGGPCNLENILETFKNWVAENEQFASGILGWLQEWYLGQGDEYWGEYYCIHIARTDVSEWNVEITILETDLESRPFLELSEKRDDTHWFRCWVSDGIFYGKGGPKNLTNILAEFREWAIAN